jgi:hypothetical protein
MSSALTRVQRERLLRDGYVWVNGIGVLWKAPPGLPRRAPFASATMRRARRQERYIDSEGRTVELRAHPLR